MISHEHTLLGLPGKVVIITGAATGLGAATAKLLAMAGANVVINHMPEQEAQAKAIAANFADNSFCYAADITDDHACRAMVQTTMERWGGVDVLINNAGINKPVEHTDLEGLSAQDFITIYNVNVVGASQMIRAVAPTMQQQGSGVVVNVSSGSGASGYGSSVAYSASKGALNTLTKSLGRALAPAIRVNAICPGMVVTELWDKLAHTPEQRASWLNNIVEEIPLKKEPTADIVARCIVFLASDLSAHLTGQLIAADGGSSLGLYSPMYAKTE